MTSFPLAESRAGGSVRHELVRRTLRVTAREPLTDTLVRFTLAGEDLAGFSSLGPADHVKVFFPVPGTDEQVGRDYTPSTFRPHGASGLPELDLDVVVHGEAGPATAWASRAQPGDELRLGGPRGSRLAPSGFRNALLIADPTGAPALRRWIHAYRGTLPVRALFYGDDTRLTSYLDADETALAHPELVPSDALVKAVAGCDIDLDTFVWAAGEATALVPVRRYLKRDLGLPRENLSVHGYWRAGATGVSSGDPIDPTDPD